jgi:hypothetical protein
MRLITAGLVALCIATAALAQEAPPAMTYNWDARPDAMAFARAYPERAVQGNVEGAAVMCCTVNEDRRLNCRVPLEWPAGYGFGAATLSIARDFRLSENTYAQIRNDPDHMIRRTIRWQISGSPDTPPASFTDAARTACDGPAAPIS